MQMAQPSCPEQVELPISNVAILKTFCQGSLMERTGPSMMMGKPSSGVKIVWKSLESQCLALSQFVAFFLEERVCHLHLYQSLSSGNRNYIFWLGES